MSSETKKHPYHLVDPSPWPLLGSVAAVVMAIGAITYMKGGTPIYMFAGLALILYTMYVWWRDIIKEAQTEKAHTTQVQFGLKFGVFLFIVSEVMFFVAWFWAFFNASLGHSPAGEVWPPEGIEPMGTWGLPFINTLILITSGFVLEWGHKGLLKEDRSRAIKGVVGAVILGAIFLGLQVHEYGEAAFGFTDGIYSSVFYMATGFHGFHVFVGVVALAVCALRLKKGDFTSKQHIGLLSASWYWHFVDVVWIFLFCWVYWWGNSAFFAQ
ncbi:MAG: cytochrome c oxidase subunit 3 [Methylocystaceae bacterium]|nr:cytochrome c oxidase subunit 3 [Methylocystaceae bacterium]